MNEWLSSVGHAGLAIKSVLSLPIASAFVKNIHRFIQYLELFFLLAQPYVVNWLFKEDHDVPLTGG